MNACSSRVLVVASILLALPVAASADPCGMVPPVYIGQGQPITRIGLQQTYVFYKDGVETFVIRPGFTGQVDEFGMLIPFPAPPALRKVPDHIFPHLAAAVDPPEVVVDMRWRYRYASSGQAKANGAVDALRQVTKRLGDEEVRVIREEAVGMYEVAVLEAGSPAALKKWMDEHGYRYPEGMDTACAEYVDDGWCFVAVKTKVGQKAGVDPQPAQRKVDSKLAAGAGFDGHVQAMGFRFPSEELVVPMRLASFNAGELRNVVYLVTDQPQKIRSIPEEYVVRQITGEELVRNVTELLPLRVIGGTAEQIPEPQRKNLDAQRDPAPRNAAAKELFASDLLAASSGELSLPHEEREKDLLAIGERLGLRGGDIDRLHEQALAEARSQAIEGSLVELQDMSLTVVDGDFPREVLARKNLRFGQYRMPARRNKSESYDAKTNGPAEKLEGAVYLGALPPRAEASAEAIAQNRPTGPRWSVMALALAAVAMIIGATTLRGRYNGRA